MTHFQTYDCSPFSVPLPPLYSVCSTSRLLVLTHFCGGDSGIVSISCIPNIDFLLSKCGERAARRERTASDYHLFSPNLPPPPFTKCNAPPPVVCLQSPPCLKGGRSRFLWENPAWGGKPPFKIGGREGT